MQMRTFLIKNAHILQNINLNLKVLSRGISPLPPKALSQVTVTQV